jgi:ABC-type transporter Mla subunit MlaD
MGMNIASWLEQSLMNINPASLTNIFIYLMLIVFIMGIVFVFMRRHSHFTGYVPTLLTSAGILGTFAGIVVGLLHFNQNDIDGSIGVLLGGLKVAFITSLVGIFLSILFKAIESLFFSVKEAKNQEVPEEVEAKDLYQVLKEQQKSLQILQKTIGDDNESSIVGQLKLLRINLTDNAKELHTQVIGINEKLSSIDGGMRGQKERFEKFSETLWRNLDNFAQMLSKSATEQVIEALNAVIKDFNQKLTEQFGENFKELNSAVLKLVQWQENYKDQIVQMQEGLQQSVVAIEHSEKSLEHISEESQNIPQTMENLKEVLEVNQHQIEELSRHLDAFAQTRDRAVEAVPEIRERIEETLSGVKEASDSLVHGIDESAMKISTVMIATAEDFHKNVTQTNAALIDSSTVLSQTSEEIKTHLGAAVEDMNLGLRQLTEKILEGANEIKMHYEDAGASLMNEIQKLLQLQLESLKSLGEQISQNIETLGQSQVREIQKIQMALDETIETELQQTSKAVQKQIDFINETSAKEIENVMNEMGRALAAISGQFTSDYQKLVREMESVVNAHRNG